MLTQRYVVLHAGWSSGDSSKIKFRQNRMNGFRDVGVEICHFLYQRPLAYITASTTVGLQAVITLSSSSLSRCQPGPHRYLSVTLTQWTVAPLRRSEVRVTLTQWLWLNDPWHASADQRVRVTLTQWSWPWHASEDKRVKVILTRWPWPNDLDSMTRGTLPHISGFPDRIS